MSGLNDEQKRVVEDLLNNAQGRFVEWESDEREFRLATYKEWM